MSAARSQSAFPQVVLFCSGRAGVGKSTALANLAWTAAEQGISCLLWDADLAMPSLHLLFGLSPLATAADAYLGNAAIESIPVQPRPGLWLLPERAGTAAAAAHLSQAFPTLLGRLLARFAPQLVLIDTPPGWSELLLSMGRFAHTWAIVFADDIGSILDAYGLLKTLLSCNDNAPKQLGLVLTHVLDDPDAASLAVKFNTVVQHFFGKRLPVWASLPYDPRYREALVQQRLVVELFPQTPTARAYRQLLTALVPSTETLAYEAASL